MNIKISQLFSLEGKNILISGATGYLGSNLSIALASAGASVYVNSRTPNSVSKLVDKIRKNDFKAYPACFDITKENEVEKFFQENKNLKIDCIINNANISITGNILLTESKDYEDVFNVNIIGANNLIKYGIQNLRSAVKFSGSASIINISSIYGINSPKHHIYSRKKNISSPCYGVAKSALIQYTKYLAIEFGKEGIRSNTISPGPFPGPEVVQKNPFFIKKLSSHIPLGRIGHPKELEGVTIFLASDSSSFLNGSNIVVDGGWTAW